MFGLARRSASSSRGVWCWCALVAAAFAQTPASAPFAMLEKPIPPTTMRLVGFGDFDGDGDLDLFGLGAPYVLLNDGDGRFTPLAATSAAAGPLPSASFDPTRYVIADFTGDGRADLVVTSDATATTTVGTLFTSTGGVAAFTATILPAPSGALGRVLGGAAADVDTDGLLDLVVGRALPVSPGSLLHVPAPVDVLKNTGGGVFAPLGNLGLGNAVPRFVDLDADGDADAAFGFGGVQFNLGGTFGPAIPALGGPAAPFGPTPVDARFNNDAFPDLVVGDGAQIATFFGSPSGFVAGPTLVGPAPGVPYGSPAPCDSDGDGVDEIYVPLGSSGGLSRYDVVGAALVAGPLDTAFHDQFSNLVADIDGDGREDLVSRSASHATLITGAVGQFVYDVRFGAGPAGSPGFVAETGALPTRPLIGGLAVADLDADGDLDLAGLERAGVDVRLAIATNDDSGTFTWTPKPLYPSGSSPAGNTMIFGQVVAGDFDGDGDVDLATIETYPLLVGGFNLETVAVRPLPNDGAGGFASATVYSLPSFGGASRTVVGDFDLDGRDDLVFNYSFFGASGLQFYRGTATGLIPFITNAGLPAATDLAAGDLDGDGDLDLVSAGASPTLLVNNGAFSFAPSNVFGTTATSYAAIVDADLDGDLDVWMNQNLWLQGGGTWTFSGVAATNAAPGAYATMTFDFEGDGDLDTYVGSGWIHLSGGAGLVSSFEAPVSLSRLSTFADLDGDGDRDLVYMPTATTLTARPFGPPRVFLNRARQATLDAAFRPGRATHVGLHGFPGGAYFLFASLATTSVSAPPFGVIRLDAASAILVAGGVLDATGTADAVGFLPPSFSALVGLEIDLQGVVDAAPGPRLTNLRRAVIR
jgi:hypothetical protein